MRSIAVVRFFERYVVEIKKQLCMGDQRGLFPNIISVQLEEMKKAKLQYIRDEKRTLPRNKIVHPREMGAIFPLAVERKTRHV